MAPLGGLLWRSRRVYQIWGANTDVGKTVISTILCLATRGKFRKEHTAYLKPVSTGPIEDADDQYVLKYIRSWKGTGRPDNALKYAAKCLVQYDEPVSPDIAAAMSEQGVVSDSDLLKGVHDYALKYSGDPGWLFVETAGGVHSPGPSGTSQADLYRPLRLPAILVADSRLGGISATISAFESLKMRGYDVEAVLMFKNDQYQNHNYLSTYFNNFGIPCTTVHHPPERNGDPAKEKGPMLSYYRSMMRYNPVRDTIDHLAERHKDRLRDLESMSTEAHKTIWYPFTQQKLLPPEKITAIDSAYGDYFQTFSADLNKIEKATEGQTVPDPAKGISAVPRKERNAFRAALPARIRPHILRASFDGSASWWTQGLGHANPQLTLAAAYAAGRYGHVMFAEAVHQPALKLAKMLLRGSKNPRLFRVFYSDDGSTATEVAIKMALRASRVRYGWGPREPLGVIGLKGSYHGDTMGAMDASEPCIYNEKVEWYQGKGFWFDFPTVSMKQGVWTIDIPDALLTDGKVNTSPSATSFTSLNAIFDIHARQSTPLYESYCAYVTRTLAKLKQEGRKFGALILEPVVLGAGGMLLADPLFQRALVQTVRREPHLFSDTAPDTEASPAPDTEASPAPDRSLNWSGLPVVFDEVFTGLYRLGRFSAASFLDVQPDVVVNAKLLTGGLLPLATTCGYASNASRALQAELFEGEQPHAWNIHARVLGNVLYLMASQTSTEETLRQLEDCLLSANALQ
ncbi:Aminotransferase class-3 [Macrophomina phaseolina MS6]|uniref:Aminotransferase class-3 n=1 Tax=Macrophomina phaseolina (strain MS6) TaxID=1126212 RepID=K2S1I3_MACPH|nr:Aminotransferase class-3 [Macrophomina phaseolina MS6]